MGVSFIDFLPVVEVSNYSAAEQILTKCWGEVKGKKMLPPKITR
jgi:hypothetical protein